VRLHLSGIIAHAPGLAGLDLVFEHVVNLLDLPAQEVEQCDQAGAQVGKT
jgi:hypothetical protein